MTVNSGKVALSYGLKVVRADVGGGFVGSLTESLSDGLFTSPWCSAEVITSGRFTTRQPLYCLGLLYTLVCLGDLKALHDDQHEIALQDLARQVRSHIANKTAPDGGWELAHLVAFVATAPGSFDVLTAQNLVQGDVATSSQARRTFHNYFVLLICLTFMGRGLIDVPGRLGAPLHLQVRVDRVHTQDLPRRFEAANRASQSIRPESLSSRSPRPHQVAPSPQELRHRFQ